MSQKIVPCLWFNKNCEEAITYYVDVFNKNASTKSPSKIISINRYPMDQQIGPVKDMGGKVLTGIFELEGQRYMAFDGGPYFKFNEAVSFYVECSTQEEVDYFWSKLSAVPESEQCGWVKDKFGVSWQIVPKQLSEMLEDSNKEKSDRALQAMLNMKKLNIKELQKAFDGK